MRIVVSTLLVWTIFFTMSLNPIIYNQNREVPIAREIVYDLVVYGADPEGIAAATVAGERGLSVLVIEERSDIGGLMTLGGLNFIDMNYDSQRNLVTRGIFKRFYDNVGGNAFEIDKAHEVFKTFLLDSKADLMLNTEVTYLTLENKRIKNITVNQNGELHKIEASYFIDASPDGVLAAMAGVPYTLFGEDIRKPDRLMGVTLVFALDQVNWNHVFVHLNTNRIQGIIANDERKIYGAGFRTAWGYPDEGYRYQPRDEQMRLRGLNAARQNDGTVLINALLIFDVNPLDPVSKARAFDRAKKELEHVIPYIQENFAGFKNARLVGTADDLYVRESRHFLTTYVLSIDDVLENRSFDDQIAIGSYPVDIQPSQPGDWGTIVGDPDKYGIPYRCLLPEDFENLLLAGKHAGYSSLAAGSARVIPIGMVTAEAAALATVLAVEKNTSFPEIANNDNYFSLLQEQIIANDGFIETFIIENPLERYTGYEHMKNLRRMGLVFGRYQNEYHFDQIIDKWTFDRIFRGLLEYHNRAEDFVRIDQYPNYGSIARLVYQVEHGYVPDIQDAYDFGLEQKLFRNLDYWTTERINAHPNVEEIYIFLSNFNDYLSKKD